MSLKELGVELTMSQLWQWDNYIIFFKIRINKKKDYLSHKKYDRLVTA